MGPYLFSPIRRSSARVRHVASRSTFVAVIYLYDEPPRRGCLLRIGGINENSKVAEERPEGQLYGNTPNRILAHVTRHVRGSLTTCPALAEQKWNAGPSLMRSKFKNLEALFNSTYRTFLPHSITPVKEILWAYSFSVVLLSS